MASSIIAIMPQLSAIASRVSRSSTANAACSEVLALPLSRCASAQATERAQRPVAVIEVRRQRHVLRTVHRPVLSRRRERMMRVGKRRHHEERLVAIAGGVAVEPFAAFLGDVGGRIELLRDRRAERLRADVVVRELVLAVAQRVGVGPPRLQPDVVVAADLVAVGRCRDRRARSRRTAASSRSRGPAPSAPGAPGRTARRPERACAPPRTRARAPDRRRAAAAV